MKILFVYNANSGLANSIMDIGHKFLSPNTYSCNLCQLTHGLLSEKKEWKMFKEKSQYNLEFLHKDEFELKYKQKKDYPVILKCNENNDLEILLGTQKLNKISKLDDLIKTLPL